MALAALVVAVIAVLIAVTSALYARSQRLAVEARSRRAALRLELVDHGSDARLVLTNDGPGVADWVSLDVVGALGPGDVPLVLWPERPFQLPPHTANISRIEMTLFSATEIECDVRWTDGAGFHQQRIPVALA